MWMSTAASRMARASQSAGPSERSHAAYRSRCSGLVKISTLEIMCEIRNPIRTMPVTAIATFFPTVVSHSAKSRFIAGSDDRLDGAYRLGRLVQRRAFIGAQRNVHDPLES